MSTDKTPRKKLNLKSFKFSVPKISFKKLNKNAVLAISLTAVLVIVGVFTVILTGDKKTELAKEESVNMQEASTEKTISAVIKQQEGSFQIKPTEGDWNDATTTDALAEGYSIRTVGAVSKVIVAFEDGSELRIDANSEVSLETVRADRIVIKHVSGYTYNRVVPSDSLTYIITSKDATYEAQGTAFRTATTGDEQAVEVFHSSVIETNSNKSPKTGQKLTVKSNVNPSSNGKIEQLDIEKIKNDAFLQWNRELDANNDKFKKDLGFLQDIVAPEITLKTSDGDVIFLDPSATEGTIEISGNTETGSKVTALSKSQSGAQPVDVTVGSDGNFTTPVLSAPLGSSVFEFVVKDKTGNTTTKTLRVTFQRKSQSITTTKDSIELTATKVGGDKVKFEWTFASGTTAPDGVKLVYGSSANPIFKTDGSATAGYYPTGTGDTLKYDGIGSGLETDKTYYFRVCVYDSSSNSCGPYSNQVTVKP
jgi:hypothetical protein